MYTTPNYVAKGYSNHLSGCGPHVMQMSARPSRSHGDLRLCQLSSRLLALPGAISSPATPPSGGRGVAASVPRSWCGTIPSAGEGAALLRRNGRLPPSRGLIQRSMDSQSVRRDLGVFFMATSAACARCAFPSFVVVLEVVARRNARRGEGREVARRQRPAASWSNPRGGRCRG